MNKIPRRASSYKGPDRALGSTEMSGGPAWIRTRNQQIMSLLL